MKIRSQPFILHVPVNAASISHSTHTITHCGVDGAKIVTEDGQEGFGFTGTHAHLASDRLVTACIAEDALDGDRLSLKVARHPALQWVGRAGVTQIALAAVDIALWDLRAKAAGLSLWRLLGGATKKSLEAYNTDVGWLSIPKEPLVQKRRHAIENDGSVGSSSRSAMPIQ
jgi:L-alanine-DL-glutamate epimerase-like enolase superfamily enzyme